MVYAQKQKGWYSCFCIFCPPFIFLNFAILNLFVIWCFEFGAFCLTSYILILAPFLTLTHIPRTQKLAMWWYTYAVHFGMSILREITEKNFVEKALRWLRLRGNAFRRFWKRTTPRIVGFIFLFVLVCIAYTWAQTHYPPQYATTEVIIEIPEGASVKEIAHILAQNGIIEHPFWLLWYARFSGVASTLRAGEYYFPTALSVRDVVLRLAMGEYGMEALRITVPEGSTSYQMAELFAKRLDNFDTEAFLAVAEEKEGYLFPDTYRFLPNTTTEEVLQVLERTFYEKVDIIEPIIASSSIPVHEVITMASLIEREASDFEQRRLIAGILWNRIAIDMPLQVDAVFGYIERRETFHPSFSDLEVESLYNTYLNKGLPPGPIGSPSLEAIEAAVTPLETDALYYLHGSDGSMHVAETFEGHKLNRAQYL
jgi:UPF0755 protein